jgi:uncharacterized protein YjiK
MIFTKNKIPFLLKHSAMLKKYLSLLFIITIVLSCKTKSSKNEAKEDPAKFSDNTTAIDTSGYDLSHPQKKWAMAPELLEISGISWIDSTHVLAIEDIRPILYLINLKDTATIEKQITFAETSKDKFDVEDVTVVGSTAYALWSHGKIFKIKDWQNKPQTEEIKTFLKKNNNTEGLCYDPVLHDLLVACKNNSDLEEEKKSTRSVYEFDMEADTLKEIPFLLIHKKDFISVSGEKLDFYPSAIAVHPITKDIYILSTKENKCMAQYSHDGQLKSVQFFDKEILPQAEGLCFAPDGTMFISTEGRHGQPAMIYKFAYSK